MLFTSGADIQYQLLDLNTDSVTAAESYVNFSPHTPAQAKTWPSYHNTSNRDLFFNSVETMALDK